MQLRAWRLLIMHKALASTPNTAKKEKKNPENKLTSSWPQQRVEKLVEAQKAVAGEEQRSVIVAFWGASNVFSQTGWGLTRALFLLLSLGLWLLTRIGLQVPAEVAAWLGSCAPAFGSGGE